VTSKMRGGATRCEKIANGEEEKKRKENTDIYTENNATSMVPHGSPTRAFRKTPRQYSTLSTKGANHSGLIYDARSRRRVRVSGRCFASMR
jgi:hypothetical protein